MRQYDTKNITRAACIKFIGNYFIRYIPNISLLFIILIVGIFVSLTLPQLLKYYIDNITAQSSTFFYPIIGILYILISTIDHFLQALRYYFTASITGKIENDMRIDTISNIIDLDINELNLSDSGSFFEIFNEDISTVSNFLMIFILDFVYSFFLLISTIYIIFTIHIAFGIISITTFLLILAVNILFRESTFIKLIEIRNMYEKLMTIQENIFKGITDIHIYNAFLFFANKCSGIQSDISQHELYNNLHINIKQGASHFIFSLSFICLFYFGFDSIRNGILSLGSIIVLIEYLKNLRSPLLKINSQVFQYNRIYSSLSRLYKVSIMRKENDLVEKGEINKGRISFRNVFFSYQNNCVLKNINLEIKNKECIGILGRTGSGKTTLVKLLTRLYEPSKGTININNRNINTIGKLTIRKRIIYIPQDIQLFDSTLRNNITMFNPNIKDDDIMKAIYDVYLSDWFSTQTDGLDTEMHTNSLSQGEAQLLMVCRAMLFNPAILILDEINSKLDFETNRKIMNAIRKISKRCTTILILHNINTLNLIRTIVILSDGEIIESGSTKELLRDSNSHLNKYISLLQNREIK